MNRQCSSGLQAVVDVAVAIRARFCDIGNIFLDILHLISLTRGYDFLFFFFFFKLLIFYIILIGTRVGLESMTSNPMAWEGNINPKVCIFFCTHSVFFLELD